MSLTTAETAARLRLSEPAVRKLVERHQLEPIRRGARPLEFAEPEVDAYQQRRWREQQRRSQLSDAWAETMDLVAAQVSGVSRCGHAQPSRNPVVGLDPS